MEQINAVERTGTMNRPHIPLTDAQFADYCDLMMQANSLRLAGKHEEATLVSRVAKQILQSGAPRVE